MFSINFSLFLTLELFILRMNQWKSAYLPQKQVSHPGHPWCSVLGCSIKFKPSMQARGGARVDLFLSDIWLCSVWCRARAEPTVISCMQLVEFLGIAI